MAPSLLSASERQEYFEEAIQLSLGGVIPSSGRKKATILAGQPGSGKTGLSAKAIETAQETGGAVVVDIDELRKSHEHYLPLMRADDKTAAEKTHEDASAAAEAVRKAAIEQGLDLIIDGTLKTPDKAERLVQELVDAGYEVEVIALAVPPEASWQGVLDRYQRDKRADGYGRWVPRGIHDAAVEGMVRSLERIEQQGKVSFLKIVDRSGNVIHYASQPKALAAAGIGAEQGQSEIASVMAEARGTGAKPPPSVSFPSSSSSSGGGGGGGRPAARLADPTAHGAPLNPGTGSPYVIIGGKPAWRGLPAAAAVALQSAQAAVDASIKTAEAATMAAAGTPGAPAAYATEQAAKTAAAASMSATMSGMAAAAGAASGGAVDIHMCPIPTPVPPHGPGMVIDGSQTVLVNGLPLCRQGDTVLEALGGPDKIVMGMPNVLIGG